MPSGTRFVVSVSVLLVLLCGGVLTSLGLGAEQIDLQSVVGALLGDAEVDETARFIVREIRVPRALTALLVGAALASSGVLLQGVMRNPLAAPNIVGITSGGGLAAAIVLGVSVSMSHALPVAAFIGAFATGLLVYFLSWQPGVGATAVRLVLAGVAVSAMLGAITTYLMIATNRAQQIVLWMAGNMSAATWDHVRLASPYVGVGVIGAWLMARPLNLLQLGDDGARSLGLGVERTRFGAIALASMLAAAAVSVAGMIGFVGLMMPHIARLLVGHRHGRVLPVGVLGGASLLVWADVAAENALATQPVPVGVVTALLGGPYFLLLLHRSRLIR